MPSPPRSLELLIGLLIPPACREEVLGDLHERFTNLPRYVADVLTSVPFVILSRIRRTTDFQVLLMEACVLYLSFWGAARLEDVAFLDFRFGYLRLAIPAATTLLFLMLADAYAVPGRGWVLKSLRAPVFGLAIACLSQLWLPKEHPDLTLPRWILLCGEAAGLLLVCTVRMLSPPPADRPQGAGGPVFWLHLDSVSLSPEAWRIAKGAGMLAVAALLGALLGYGPKAAPQVLVILAVAIAAYQVRRWR